MNDSCLAAQTVKRFEKALANRRFPAQRVENGMPILQNRDVSPMTFGVRLPSVVGVICATIGTLMVVLHFVAWDINASYGRLFDKTCSLDIVIMIFVTGICGFSIRKQRPVVANLLMLVALVLFFIGLLSPTP
jgi:hypothetical protein